MEESAGTPRGDADKWVPKLAQLIGEGDETVSTEKHSYVEGLFCMALKAGARSLILMHQWRGANRAIELLWSGSRAMSKRQENEEHCILGIAGTKI